MSQTRDTNPGNWRFAHRVAYVVSHARPWSSNGYAVRTHAIATSLAQAGHEVIVFTRPGRPWDIEGFPNQTPVMLDQHIDGVRHICLPLPPMPGATPTMRVRAMADALTEAFYVFRPGAVLAASNWETAEPARRAAGRTGASFFYEQRGFWEMGKTVTAPDALPPKETRQETEIAMSARAVFTLNATMRDELVQRGVPAGRIALVPNGLSRPGRIDKRITRKSLGSTARYMLGYIGSLSSYEGVETLIDLVARLRAGRDHPALDVDALIVGSDAPKGLIGAIPGPYAGAAGATLRAQADRLGVGAHVHILPQQPEGAISSYYALCDAMVLPRKRTSVTERVPPLKPYAAAAHGVPVFMTDLPPMAEIAAEIHGSLFAEGDMPGLTAMVHKALLQGHPASVAVLDPALDWSQRVAPILRHLDDVAQAEQARNARLLGETTAHSTSAGPKDILPQPRQGARFDLAVVPRVALQEMLGGVVEARIGPMTTAAEMQSVLWLTRANLLDVMATAQPGRFVIDWTGLQADPDTAKGDWAGLWSIEDMRLNRLIMDAVRIGLDRGWRLQVLGPVPRSKAPLFRTVASVMEEIPPSNGETS